MEKLINNKLIKPHFEALVDKYPDLQLYYNATGNAYIAGWVQFSASFNKEVIKDKYLIEITIPIVYPEIAPLAKEIGGCIPNDFHKLIDNYLCLGVPLAVQLRFKKNPCLLHYFNDLLIPYLYAYSYFQKYSKMPYGDEKHNENEKYYFYSGKLFTECKNRVILDFIGILSGQYRGHLPCPCESGFILRNCHGTQLRELSLLQPFAHYEIDYRDVLLSIMKTENKIYEKVITSYWTPKHTKNILSKNKKLVMNNQKV